MCRVERQQRWVCLAPVLLEIVGQVIARLVQLILVDYQIEHVLNTDNNAKDIWLK